MFLDYRIRIFAISGFVLVPDVDMVVFGHHATLFTDSIIFTVVLDFVQCLHPGSFVERQNFRFTRLFRFVLLRIITKEKKGNLETHLRNYWLCGICYE